MMTWTDLCTSLKPESCQQARSQHRLSIANVEVAGRLALYISATVPASRSSTRRVRQHTTRNNDQTPAFTTLLIADAGHAAEFIRFTKFARCHDVAVCAADARYAAEMHLLHK